MVITIPAELISKFTLVVAANLMINIALFSSSPAPELDNCNLTHKQFSPTHKQFSPTHKQFSPTHKQFSPTPNFSCIHTNHNLALNNR